MQRLLATPLAELFELDFALYALFILARVVVQFFANRTPELDNFFAEFSFGHIVRFAHTAMQIYEYMRMPRMFT